MKRILVFVMIICMALLLSVGAQEKTEEIADEFVVPVPKPVTRLNVTIIDDLNDKIVKLNNCIVQVIGELHIVEDSFNYSNTFIEGDRYEMTIWIRIKK